MQSPQLDKYAKDARAWHEWAKVNYTASAELFTGGNPLLYHCSLSAMIGQTISHYRRVEKLRGGGNNARSRSADTPHIPAAQPLCFMHHM